MTNPSRPVSNGRAARARGVVVAVREGPDDVEGAERERAERDLAAAGDGRVDASLAQVAERLAERHGARGARIGGREDRAADVERDAQVRRRRATEDRERQVRRDLADAALHVPLVLLLGIGDATEGRAEVDADPLRRGWPGAPGARPASSSARRPATSPNWLKRSSWRAVLGGIQASGSKSSTWAATCERNALGSNRSMRFTGEWPFRNPARNASTPVPIAVMTPKPVIQMRRRSLIAARSSGPATPPPASRPGRGRWRASGRRWAG